MEMTNRGMNQAQGANASVHLYKDGIEICELVGDDGRD